VSRARALRVVNEGAKVQKRAARTEQVANFRQHRGEIGRHLIQKPGSDDRIERPALKRGRQSVGEDVPKTRGRRVRRAQSALHDSLIGAAGVSRYLRKFQRLAPPKRLTDQKWERIDIEQEDRIARRKRVPEVPS